MLVFLLDDADADRVLLVWDDTGGTSTAIVMGCRLCGAEFDRGRSRMGTSSTCREPCPEFARLRWDEREGALTTCGATGEGCRWIRDLRKIHKS